MTLAGSTIVFLNNYGGPGLGGGEVQLTYLLRAAVSSGMNVHLVAQRASRLAMTSQAMGIVVHEMNLDIRGIPLVFAQLRRLLAEIEPDIVQGTGFLTNHLARLASPPDSKVVSTVHVEPDASMFDGGSRLAQFAREAAERVTRNRAHVQVAVSQAVADRLVAKGVAPGSIRVIHNGVDIAALREEAGSTSLPEVLLESDYAHLVTVVSRLEPVKGVVDFLESVELLPLRFVQGKGLMFAIAGDGSQAAEIRRRRDSLLARDHVRLLGALESAAGLVAASTVVVVPSRSEGFGLVAVEAMALGVPVVANAVGGLPEIVKDGVCGRLVRHGDRQSMADAISDLVSDTALRNAMGEAGRLRAERHFSSDRMVAEYLELYSELLG
ncbi:MAG: glycosyltransferase family 4 protein [Coriobacteriia bacterium]